MSTTNNDQTASRSGATPEPTVSAVECPGTPHRKHTRQSDPCPLEKRGPTDRHVEARAYANGWFDSLKSTGTPDITDPWTREDRAKGYRLLPLPCGCQDVEYFDGFVDEEHNHVECDGEPVKP